jgi:hypothetical protein
MKLLIFVAFLVGTSFAADCTSDNVKAVQTCYLSYFIKYGLKSMPDYNTYIATANNYVNRNGLKGETTVQGWVKTRIACLQPYVPNCVTVDAMKVVFSTDNDTIARQWATTRPIEDWEFTDGFNELTSNYDCLRSMHNLHSGDLQNCANNMTAGFQHGFSCQVTYDYVNCMTNAYNKYCGKSSADFICHSTSISMNFNFPQCTSGMPTCPGSSKKGIFGRVMHMLKHHRNRLLNGKH